MQRTLGASASSKFFQCRGNCRGAASPDNLSAEWDTVYGTGFYVANVLGTRLYARAVLTGNRGTTLNVELYKPDKVENTTIGAIKGVAKDDKGNIYKVAF